MSISEQIALELRSRTKHPTKDLVAYIKTTPYFSFIFGVVGCLMLVGGNECCSIYFLGYTLAGGLSIIVSLLCVALRVHSQREIKRREEK